MIAVVEPETDWPRQWREYHTTRRIGRRCVIAPPWEQPESAPGDCLITIDPGMAFGTGSHATTQLALESLEKAVFDGARVADIGTGTGILAIAAGLLGASCVLATDIDILAREIAQQNVELHALRDTVEVLDPTEFWRLADDCDIVVVNIVAGVILELAARIADAVVPGGTVVLSGLVADQAPLICRALADVGLVSPDVVERDGWVALSLVADPAARRDTGALAAVQRELLRIGSAI
ncbi:MAG: 50S ribosomal protein L11 methyltransferase [Armatimonadetes bacterium]|nr:50S ribosomal protein L11 methyltransferase [Armatimonadota bacterium]MDE2205385.1 50S ribosomal protein L11 methyltransferase [Armatimonadota bacterium]